MKKKKFKIVDDIQTLTIKEKELPDEVLETSKRIELRTENFGDVKNNNYLLLIENSAFHDLQTHIQWGNNHTINNRNEQGGLLIGSIYYDSKREWTYGIVKEILFSHSTDSSSVSLEMGHNTWKDMLNEYDEKYSSKDDCYLIGWYHTHPNNLDVFMSHVDKNTQKRFFNQEWHFAIVLNPHKEIWKAFHGKDAIPCKGIVYLPKGKKPLKMERVEAIKTENSHKKFKKPNNKKKKKIIIIP